MRTCQIFLCPWSPAKCRSVLRGLLPSPGGSSAPGLPRHLCWTCRGLGGGGGVRPCAAGVFPLDFPSPATATLLETSPKDRGTNPVAIVQMKESKTKEPNKWAIISLGLLLPTGRMCEGLGLEQGTLSHTPVRSTCLSAQRTQESYPAWRHVHMTRFSWKLKDKTIFPQKTLTEIQMEKCVKLQRKCKILFVKWFVYMVCVHILLYPLKTAINALQTILIFHCTNKKSSQRLFVLMLVLESFFFSPTLPAWGTS